MYVSMLALECMRKMLAHENNAAQEKQFLPFTATEGSPLPYPYKILMKKHFLWNNFFYLVNCVCAQVASLLMNS
jgi:hypothetical protein